MGGVAGVRAPGQARRAHLCRLGLGVAGGPAGKERQCLLGLGAALGGVEQQGETGVGGQLHRLEPQVEVADGGVAQPLMPAAVELDVVGGRALAEALGAGGVFADQLDEGLVLGLRPASRRSMAASSSAIRSSSMKNWWAASGYK